MKEFILQNWRLIVELASMLIVIVFFFIKKKPIQVIDTFTTKLLEHLPEWINLAEEAGDRNNLTGEEKMILVVSYCHNFLIEHNLPIPNGIDDLIHYCVEQILSTPKKKVR